MFSIFTYTRWNPWDCPTELLDSAEHTLGIAGIYIYIYDIGIHTPIIYIIICGMTAGMSKNNNCDEYL